MDLMGDRLDDCSCQSIYYMDTWISIYLGVPLTLRNSELRVSILSRNDFGTHIKRGNNLQIRLSPRRSQSDLPDITIQPSAIGLYAHEGR
jgi:hypothetical protein